MSTCSISVHFRSITFLMRCSRCSCSEQHRRLDITSQILRKSYRICGTSQPQVYTALNSRDPVRQVTLINDKSVRELLKLRPRRRDHLDDIGLLIQTKSSDRRPVGPGCKICPSIPSQTVLEIWLASSIVVIANIISNNIASGRNLGISL